MTSHPPRRLSPLTPLVRSFVVLLAAGATVVRDVTRGDLGPTAVLFVLLLVAGAVFGTASWLRTTFWIEADELRVDTGVISRQSRRIRIDRLQGIDIVQPFMARVLGLAELRMDVAGGSSREGSLAYLSLEEARRLKDLLLTRRDELGGRPPVADEEGAAAVTGDADGVPQPVPGAGAGAVARPAPAAEVRVATVPLGDLVLASLFSGDTAVILLVGLGGVVGFAWTGQWFAVSAMVPVLLGYGVAVLRRITANYAFTVSQTPAGLQVRRGLFDLNSQTIALPRVQGVLVTEPLLWRPWGWARLDVSIAGYSAGADGDGPAPSVVLPVGRRELVDRLALHITRGLDVTAVPLRPAPRRARWAAPVASRFLAVGTSPDLVVSRGGWFSRRTHAAPHARVQSLRITQGPWQRVLGLADVHADSPPGPTSVRARHRPSAEARRLFDAEVELTARARRRPPTAAEHRPR